MLLLDLVRLQTVRRRISDDLLFRFFGLRLVLVAKGGEEQVRIASFAHFETKCSYRFCSRPCSHCDLDSNPSPLRRPGTVARRHARNWHARRAVHVRPKVDRVLDPLFACRFGICCTLLFASLLSLVDFVRLLLLPRDRRNPELVEVTSKFETRKSLDLPGTPNYRIASRNC